MMPLRCLFLAAVLSLATVTFAPAQELAPDPADDKIGGAPADVAETRALESAELDRREAVAASVQGLVQGVETQFQVHGTLSPPDFFAPLFSVDARAVTGPDGEDRDKLEVRRVSNFAAGAPGRPIAVERFEIGAFSLDEETGPEDALDDLIHAYSEVRRALGGPPTRPTEVHTKEISVVESSDHVFDVRLHLHYLRAPIGSSALSVGAVLRVRVAVENDEPKLLAFCHRIDSRVQSAGPSDTEGFIDVTGSVLTGPRAALLRPSIPALRDLLDNGLGVGVLGHHGVAVTDLDGNGIEDLYLPQPGGIPNQLWLRQPDGTAREVAGQVGLDFTDATTSAIFVDLDGDGDRDACMGFDGTVRIFVRVGDTYTQAATFQRGAITGLAAADTNGDGLAELYACAYANPYNGTAFPVPYHDASNGQDNIFLLNLTKEADKLVFADATQGSGLSDGASRFSFAATFEDFDEDGDMDLYVANDFGRNALYVNSGDGQFTEQAESWGIVDIGAGMAASFADFNGDARVDLYVSNMASSAGRRITGQEVFQARADEEERALLKRHAKGNTLYLGAEDGSFEETSLAAAARWAWGALPIDLDGNGALDIYVPNGFVTGSSGKAPDL